jgi:hypothetical protein
MRRRSCYNRAVRWPPARIAMWLSVAACFDPQYPGGDAGLDAPVACPAGYEPNPRTGSSYRVSTTPQKQAAAVADCADDGPRTHLTIPDNQAENVEIDSLATNDSWLGINDAAADGTWTTVLGTAQGFFRWAPGQPDGGTLESCAFVADAVWQDADCVLPKYYVCECR